jgi:hypothetical protein
MSTANPMYDTLKNLDEDDIIMDYSDDKLLNKLDEIEKKERKKEKTIKNMLKFGKSLSKLMII